MITQSFNISITENIIKILSHLVIIGLGIQNGYFIPH